MANTQKDSEYYTKTSVVVQVRSVIKNRDINNKLTKTALSRNRIAIKII